MKSMIGLSIILCVTLSISTIGFTQGLKVYSHPNPKLNIQFEAPEGWVEVPWSNDDNAYEIRSPDGVVHVLLWFTETEQDGPGYLRKMADMKDLIFEEELSEREIQGREAWAAKTSGVTNDFPISLILAVIETDHSSLPKHNGQYIIQIWCPEKEFVEQVGQMESILNSVVISDDPETE